MRSLPVFVSVPAFALPGDTLKVMTQLGLQECPLPNGCQPGKAVEVQVPVPEDAAMASVVEKLTQSRGKLVVAWVKLYRDGVEVVKPPPLERIITVVVPASAKAGDTLTIETETLTCDLKVPPGAKRTIEAAVPVPEGTADTAPMTVKRLLLNGEDIAATPTTRTSLTPTPRTPWRRSTSESAGQPTRKLVVTIPAAAKPGDTLAVQTELGLYQLQVPAKPGRTMSTNVPVPTDCALQHLTVAWVQLGEAALLAAATAGSTPLTASPRRQARDEAREAFFAADDEDEGEPAAPEEAEDGGSEEGRLAARVEQGVGCAGPGEGSATGGGAVTPTDAATTSPEKALSREAISIPSRSHLEAISIPAPPSTTAAACAAAPSPVERRNEATVSSPSTPPRREGHETPSSAAAAAQVATPQTPPTASVATVPLPQTPAADALPPDPCKGLMDAFKRCL